MSKATVTNPDLYNVLLRPHISEKSSIVADKHRQFVFEVAVSASKPTVRRAVEALFNVEVDSVRIVNVSGKVKRFGNTMGRRRNWKKAYVALKEGFDINFVDVK